MVADFLENMGASTSHNPMSFHGLLQELRGCAVAQAVSRRLLALAVRVRARVRSCEICGEQSDNRAGFLLVDLLP
jgi:hypothetical protein